MFGGEVRGSLAGVRTFLLAVVLTGLAAQFAVPRAQAQVPPPVGGLVALAGCTGPQAVICAVVVGGLLAYAVHMDLRSDESHLEALATSIGGWWNGLSDEEQVQYGALTSTGYLYVTPGLLEAVAAGMYGAGWTPGVMDYTTGAGTISAAYMQYDEASPSLSVFSQTIISVIIPPPHACVGAAGTKYWRIALTAPAGTAFNFEREHWYFDAAGVKTSGGAPTTATIDGRAGTTTTWVEVGTTDGSCGVGRWRPGYGPIIQFRFRGAFAGTPIGVRVGPQDIKYDSGSPNRFRILSSVPLFQSLGGLASGETVRVGVPANPDDLIGGVRDPALPLITGEVAVPVAPVAGAVAAGGTSLTDSSNRPWWESMFGSITSALGALQAQLSGVALAVQSIGDFVTDFPAQLTAALTTVFVPTTTLTAAWTAMRADIEAAAPACAVDGVTTAVSSVFNVSSGPLVIPMGPYGDMTIGNEWGWLDDFRALTGIAAWFLFAAYVIRTVRGFFGSSPGGGEGE